MSLTSRSAHPGVLAGPPLACAALAVAVWLITGAGAVAIVAFAAFQLFFVLLPGVVLLRMLRPAGDSLASTVALGWPLGYVVEILAFAATAQAGVRWLFFVYPVLFVVAAVVGRDRIGREWAGALPRLAAGPAWALFGVVAVALLVIAVGPLAGNPLPGSVPSVALYNDLVFDISLAAEAVHHWPVTDPNVDGQSLRYHLFVFLDAAAFHQVTGVALDVTVLRLQPVLALLLVAFEVAWLASRVPRVSRWILPGAVAIVFLANELDGDPGRSSPSLGLFTENFVLSPTFAFGAIFFTAVIGLLLTILSRPVPPRAGTWLVVAALLVGAMGAKASTMPIILAALGAFLAGRLILDRAIDRNAAVALGVGLGTFVVVYLAVFSGGPAAGELKPFEYLEFTALAGNFTRAAPKAIGAVGITAALLVPWLGALLLLRRGHDPADRATILWLGALIGAAFTAFVLLDEPSLAQVYFLVYASPPAAVLCAWGIAAAAPGLPAGRGLWAPAAAVTVLMAFVVIWMRNRAPIEGPVTTTEYLLPYAVLAAGVAVVALITQRRLLPAVAMAITMLVAASLLDKPLDAVSARVDRHADGLKAYDVDQRAGPRGVDPHLVQGLRWLRDHSDPDDVVAVNTEDVTDGSARWFYVAALAERRTFLGGSDFTATAFEHVAEARPGRPFADRRALNAAAFGGDPRALATLARRNGVRYLVLDLLHGAPQPALDRRLDRVYANRSVRIYRLPGR